MRQIVIYVGGLVVWGNNVVILAGLGIPAKDVSAT